MHVDSEPSAGGLGSKLALFPWHFFLHFPSAGTFCISLSSWSHFADEKLEHYEIIFSK